MLYVQVVRSTADDATHTSRAQDGMRRNGHIVGGVQGRSRRRTMGGGCVGVDWEMWGAPARNVNPPVKWKGGNFKRSLPSRAAAPAGLPLAVVTNRVLPKLALEGSPLWYWVPMAVRVLAC